MVNIDAGNGDLGNSFQESGSQLNRTLIADAFGKTDFLKKIPAHIIDAIAAYPESAKCAQQ